MEESEESPNFCPVVHPRFKGSAAQQQQQQGADHRERGDPNPQCRAVRCLGPALTAAAAAGAAREGRNGTPQGKCWGHGGTGGTP